MLAFSVDNYPLHAIIKYEKENAMKGYLVRVDWSQTVQTTIFVPGSKSLKEAIQAVKDSGCNCPRLYGAGYVSSVLRVKMVKDNG